MVWMFGCSGGVVLMVLMVLIYDIHLCGWRDNTPRDG